jgi:hypothetical protein
LPQEQRRNALSRLHRVLGQGEQQHVILVGWRKQWIGSPVEES